MSGLVRVRLTNGVETNVSSAFAEEHKLEVLDQNLGAVFGRTPAPSRANGRPKKPKKTLPPARRETKTPESPVVEDNPTGDLAQNSEGDDR